MNLAQKARIGLGTLSSAMGTYTASGLCELTAPDLDTRIQHLRWDSTSILAGAAIAGGLIGYALAPSLARASRYAGRKLAGIGNFFFPKNEENKRRPNKIGLAAATAFTTGMLAGPVMARNHNSLPQWLENHDIVDRDLGWEMRLELAKQREIQIEIERPIEYLLERTRAHHAQATFNLESLCDLSEAPSHQTVDFMRTTITTILARNDEEEMRWMTTYMNAHRQGILEPTMPKRETGYGNEGMPVGWHGIGLIGNEPLIAHRTEEGLSFFLGRTKLYEEIYFKWPEHLSEESYRERMIVYLDTPCSYSGTADGQVHRKIHKSGSFAKISLPATYALSPQSPLEAARAYFCREERNPRQKEVHLLALGTNAHLFGTPIVADTGDSWKIEGNDAGTDTLFYKRDGVVHKRSIDGTDIILPQSSPEMPYQFRTE